jgi:hypothetical protein
MGAPFVVHGGEMTCEGSTSTAVQAELVVIFVRIRLFFTRLRHTL